jgi:hypothetical protein
MEERRKREQAGILMMVACAQLDFSRLPAWRLRRSCQGSCSTLQDEFAANGENFVAPHRRIKRLSRAAVDLINRDMTAFLSTRRW